MANVQVGKAHIYGLTGATATQAAIAGYATINMQTVKISHEMETETIKGQAGITTSAIANDEVINLTINFIPEASASTAVAATANLPTKLAKVVLSGFPVIAIGNTSDALNQSYYYFGGGTIDGEMDKKWTATLPLRHYETDLGNPIS